MGDLMILYLMFRPTYEIKVFKLGFYPYTPLTQMIYSGFFDRELIYIYGEHLTGDYPEKDYIILNDFSRFDSVSEVIADSDSSHNVIIYSIAGPEAYKNPTSSKKIISRQVDNRTYTKMLENQIGRCIIAN